MATPDERPVFMRGCGDLGSGAAVILATAGYRVVAIERPRPTTLRLKVAFSAAAIEHRVTVAGVHAVHITEARRVREAHDAGDVVVWTGAEADLREHVTPRALVDARLRGLSEPDLARDHAPVVIALGPGYVAGEHCHFVIETERGPRLGAVLEAGSAAAHTGIPGDIGGETHRRLLRSPVAGVFERVRDLGDLVAEGEVVAMVAGEPVRARLDGMIRGLLLSGHSVPQGKKVGDIDPRGAAAPLLEPSDKAAAVGAGVLAALRLAESRASPIGATGAGHN